MLLQKWIGVCKIRTYLSVAYCVTNNPFRLKHSRTRNKYFYPVKSAQMIYSIKGSITEIYEWRDFISNVLDREDIAARDVNNYAGANSLDLNAYFHCINTNQINYIGQTSKISGQIKEYSTDLIIRYDYHINNLYNNG